VLPIYPVIISLADYPFAGSSIKLFCNGDMVNDDQAFSAAGATILNNLVEITLNLCLRQPFVSG